MSRHRLVKNMNLADELDDDALSDGGEEELTKEQQAQMDEGLERVRALLGPFETTGLDDKVVKDALWNEYFDVERSVQWLLEERDRRQAAVERKENGDGKGLPSLPADYLANDNYEDYPEDEGFFQGPIEPYELDADGRPRVPLIHLAQAGQPPPLDVSELGSYPMQQYRLSTISEKSERTEASRHWPSKQQLYAHNDPVPASPMSSYTSYGQLIDRGEQSIFDTEFQEEQAAGHLDPNGIPPSPSPSAQLRLSDYEPAPSVATSKSRSTTSSQLRAMPILPMEANSNAPDKSVSVTQPPPPTGSKKSKLSLLASSRSAASRSSRTSQASDTSSVVTYPALRPSPESEKALSSVSSDSGSSVSTLKARSRATQSNMSQSSTSSLVRRAIKTAMEQEAGDQGGVNQGLPTPTPSQTSSRAPSQISPTDSHPKTKSKLALLAQAKANSNPERSVWMPKPSTTVKALPNTHTEYLTPIANGSTATTAITTTYQSLYSLQSPGTVVPALPPTPLDSPRLSIKSSSSSEPKKSKLAMKAKKKHEKSPDDLAPLDETSGFPVFETSPMFAPKATRSRASPSAFASILVDDRLISPSEDKHRDKESRSEGKSIGDELAQSSTLSSSGKKKRSSKSKADDLSSLGSSGPFAFDVPSPDDIVINARRGTSLGQPPAKEREKAQKLAQKTASQAGTPVISRATSPVNTPVKKKQGKTTQKGSGASTPIRFGGGMDQRQLDMSALNISSAGDEEKAFEEPPKMALAREKVIEEAKKLLNVRDGKKGVSLVVIGHVDAGKSTLMGRLLYELGMVEEKKRLANERASSKMGKSSFSWAWELDGTTEERERGITMDISQQFLATPRRLITILDAPGHKDFIPNMISGASQADCALLVVDSATGEFEAGFDRGGQTREHLVLVRSLGVSQVIVAVNKLDQVHWEKDRYDEICELLRPFLLQSGFHPTKTSFVPVGAMDGVNLLAREGETALKLNQWYAGPTLVDLLDKLEPPVRDLDSPLRLPISNVFKGQSSGIAVTGRVCGGVVQVGERVRVLPGDETAIIKSIDVDDDSRPWAAAGTSVTLNLVSIDPAQVNIGTVLCSITETIPLATVFSAKIIVFDIQVPITAGASVELFHHSRDVPATISKLVASLDRAAGTVIKQNPRVLTKGGSAEVQITLRASGLNGTSGTARGIPLEPFTSNKDMGRILLRRGGETIGAGIVLKIIA
ncbi:hypothetical protein HWV62_997 [Athelia sp. TMB]|nr:hypothetical protein HWV62_997 [Athelia sp. TMB]